MDRRFLEQFGLAKEQIDTILNANSADIGKEKTEREALIAERNSLKGQLAEAQGSLKQFEGVDVAGLNGTIAQLQADLQAKETAYRQKLAEKDFNTALAEAVRTAKSKNAKAVTALLDIDSLKASSNHGAAISQAIAALQASEPYLFEGARPEPEVITSGALGTSSTVSFAQFHQMGYRERKALKDTQPDLYKALTKG